MSTVHGTCVIVDHAGLLLRGPSGSGKSDLALRLVDLGRGQLVADDRVALERDADGALWASPPAVLAGLLEVRGIGIVAMEHAARVRVDGVVDLAPREEVVRLPKPECVTLMDVPLPRFALSAMDGSAPAKLTLIAALCRRGAGRP